MPTTSSKFDKPASVSWIVTGPDGKAMPGNKRDFPTLREAVLDVCRLAHGSRSRVVVRSGKQRYDGADCECLGREMRAKR